MASDGIVGVGDDGTCAMVERQHVVRTHLLFGRIACVAVGLACARALVDAPVENLRQPPDADAGGLFRRVEAVADRTHGLRRVVMDGIAVREEDIARRREEDVVADAVGEREDGMERIQFVDEETHLAEHRHVAQRIFVGDIPAEQGGMVFQAVDDDADDFIHPFDAFEAFHFAVVAIDVQHAENQLDTALVEDVHTAADFRNGRVAVLFFRQPEAERTVGEHAVDAHGRHPFDVRRHHVDVFPEHAEREEGLAVDEGAAGFIHRDGAFGRRGGRELERIFVLRDDFLAPHVSEHEFDFRDAFGKLPELEIREAVGDRRDEFAFVRKLREEDEILLFVTGVQQGRAHLDQTVFVKLKHLGQNGIDDILLLADKLDGDVVPLAGLAAVFLQEKHERGACAFHREVAFQRRPTAFAFHDMGGKIMAAEVVVLFVVEIESDNWNFAISKHLAVFHLDAGEPDRRPELIDASRFQIWNAKMAEHVFFAWAAFQHEAAVAVFAVAPAALVAFRDHHFGRGAFFKI